MAPTAGEKKEVPLSPTAKLDDATVHLQLQMFLDEWHFRIVESNMAKNWDRKTAVQTAVDMLHWNGATFPDEEWKQNLLGDDEEVMIGKIVNFIPNEMRMNLEEICLELQSCMSASSTLRKAIDDNSEEGLLAAVEGAEGAKGVEAILRNAVIMASQKVVKVRKTHIGWRASTEARITRLMQASEDAEHCHRQLLAVDAQLDTAGGNQKSNAKSILMGMATKNDKALTSSSFSGWLGVTMKARADNAVRSKYQAQLSEAEKKLFEYKERQLANIKGVLGRAHMEEGDNFRGTIIRFWYKQVEERKSGGDTADQVKAAKARLESMKSSQTAAAKKVLTSMSSGSDEGLLTMVFQGWNLFHIDYQKEKEFEDAVKAAEAKLKEQMDGKKDQTMKIMERMQAQSEGGLLIMTWTAWAVTFIGENKKARELEQKIAESQGKFNSLKARQSGNAQGVQGRTNELMKNNLLLRCLSHWAYDTKTQNVDSYYTRKLESKRRQLAGVQNLFRTFAAQLESGLGGDDGGESSRDNTGRAQPRPSKSKKDRSSSGADRSGSGMSNAVSLPDIHEGRPVRA